MRLGIFLPAAVLAGAASAGVGKMDAKPLWDLADHGGPRKVSAADPLEIPNAAIPNVRAFTFEATYRFNGGYELVSDAIVRELGLEEAK